MSTVKGVNFTSIIFASILAGYLYTFVDFFFNGFQGWFGGQMALLHNGQWNIFLAHELDSIFFGLVYALVGVKVLPGAGWMKGGLFGILLGIVVIIVSMIGAAGGSTVLKMMSGMPPSGMIGFFILHIVYGGTLGILYSQE